MNRSGHNGVVRERWAGWTVVGLLVVLCALLLDPAVVGLSTYEPVAHLVAIRGWLVLGAGLTAAALLGCAAMVRRRGEHRPHRLLAATVALALFAGANLGLLWSRGLTAPEALAADKGAGELDVLALNTYNTSDGPAAVAELIAEHEPDVVTLPETEHAAAVQIAGDDYQVFMGVGGPGGSAPTALLVSPSLGAYERIDGPDTEYGMVGATPVDGNGPTLYGVHTASPVGERMALWRDELELVMGICDQTANIIMAGDFNATIDHAPLRDASCANGSAGSGGVGTWPVALPAFLGSPIDHVFSDPAAWEPIGSAVVELPRADHRGLLVRLRPTGDAAG